MRVVASTPIEPRRSSRLQSKAAVNYHEIENPSWHKQITRCRPTNVSSQAKRKNTKMNNSLPINFVLVRPDNYNSKHQHASFPSTPITRSSYSGAQNTPPTATIISRGGDKTTISKLKNQLQLDRRLLSMTSQQPEPSPRKIMKRTATSTEMRDTVKITDDQNDAMSVQHDMCLSNTSEKRATLNKKNTSGHKQPCSANAKTKNTEERKSTSPERKKAKKMEKGDDLMKKARQNKESMEDINVSSSSVQPMVLIRMEAVPRKRVARLDRNMIIDHTREIDLFEAQGEQDSSVDLVLNKVVSRILNESVNLTLLREVDMDETVEAECTNNGTLTETEKKEIKSIVKDVLQPVAEEEAQRTPVNNSAAPKVFEKPKRPPPKSRITANSAATNHHQRPGIFIASPMTPSPSPSRNPSVERERKPRTFSQAVARQIYRASTKTVQMNSPISRPLHDRFPDRFSARRQIVKMEAARKECNEQVDAAEEKIIGANNSEREEFEDVERLLMEDEAMGWN